MFPHPSSRPVEVSSKDILDMVKKIGTIANKYSSTFKLSPARYSEMLKMQQTMGNFHKFRQPKYASNGYLSFSQAASLAVLLEEIFDKATSKRILALAPTQWGKTALMLALMIVLPVLHFQKTGRHAYVIMSMPSYRSLVTQAQDRMRDVWLALSPMEITCNGQTMTVMQYWDRVGCNPADPETPLLHMRCPSSAKKLVKLTNELAKTGDVYYLEDECHQGQDQKGVAAFIDRNLNKKVRRIICSATPDEALATNIDVYHIVTVFVELGYVGFPIVMDHQMKIFSPFAHVGEYKIKLPKVVSVEERYGKLLDTDLDYVNALRKELDTCKCVFLRAPERSNARLTSIAKILRSKDIGVVEFFNQTNGETLESLRKQIPQDTCVLLANNMARMGDTLPLDTGVAIDNTEVFSGANSFKQGTLGRKSGYPTDPGVCVMSEKNTNWVRDHYADQGSLISLIHPPSFGNKIKHASPRTIANVFLHTKNGVQKVEPGRDRKYALLHLKDHKKNPEIVDLFKRLSAELTRRLKREQNKDVSGEKTTAIHNDWDQKACEILNKNAQQLVQDTLNIEPRRIFNYGELNVNDKPLIAAYECRFAEDYEDFGSIARHGGGHERDGQPINQVVWRLKDQTCPVCGCHPKRSEMKNKCCRTHVPAEVYIIHMLTNGQSIDEKARKRANKKSTVEFTTKTKSRHHTL